MDNKKKIIIILGVIGLILVCGGAVMGGSISSSSTMFSESNLPEGAQNPADVKTSDVHAIVLNLVNSDISVKYGKNFDLSGTGVYNSYVKEGIYYAGADDTKRSANIFGMKVSVPSKWVSGYGSYVLTIPEKADLERITINTFHCNIAAETLQAADLNLTMSAGDLTINHLTGNTISIAVKAGKATITDPVITDSGNIQASGDLSLGDTTASASVMNNLSLSSFLGDISLIGSVTGTSQVQTDFGNVTATLPGSSTNYGLTAPEGKLTVSPTGSADSSTEHFANISFACKHGNASVDFQ